MAFPYGENEYQQQSPSAGRRIAPHGEQRVQYGNTGEKQGTESLPIIDTQRARRNFEGYEKNQWYSLDELKEGFSGGTTETDSQTETGEDHKYKKSTYKDPNYGYAKGQKSGKGGRPWKSSSPKQATETKGKY